MFQCMQSDFTDLCWDLYRNAKPVYSVALDGAPLLVVYDREAVAAALARLRGSAAPATSANATSDTNTPTR